MLIRIPTPRRWNSVPSRWCSGELDLFHLPFELTVHLSANMATWPTTLWGFLQIMCGPRRVDLVTTTDACSSLELQSILELNDSSRWLLRAQCTNWCLCSYSVLAVGMILIPKQAELRVETKVALWKFSQPSIVFADCLESRQVSTSINSLLT